MAYVNYKNSPSEETPLTGGTNGNLNVMQENGTSHGADTKLGYAQSFLNDHIINVSNEVDEDYRVNILHSKNLLEVNLSKYHTTTLSGVTNTDNGNQTITLNGTQAQNGNLYLLGNGSNIITRLKAGKTYTLKLYVVSGSLTGVGNFIMGVGGNANYRYSSISSTSESVVNTFTPTTDVNVNSLRIYATGAAGITYSNLVLKFQINEGSTALPYEPYVVPSILVDDNEIYNKDNMEQYSTNEERIGTWINGKPLYRKVVNCGTLPNSATKTIAHNISNIDFLMLKGMYATTGNYFISIPVTSVSAINNNVSSSCDKTNIYVATGTNRSEYTTTYAILEYTKTTD